MQQLTRTMIILWRWNDLNKNQPIDITNIVKSTTDKIIRIKKPKAEKGTLLIIKEAKKALKNGDAFIFLHRDDGYESKDVNHIIGLLQGFNNGHLIKCFLFGDNRDYIYFDTQDEGLLNQTGGFMNDVDYFKIHIKNGKEVIEYLDAVVVEKNDTTGKEEVKLEHFDRVWLYYQGEFHKKINELLVDFISEFVDLKDSRNNYELIPNATWRKRIEQCETDDKQYLNLRIKSFLEILEPDKEDILKAFEIKEETSFVFDDCQGNLGQHEKEEVKTNYNKLFIQLYAIYDETQGSVSSTLDNFRNAFFELLESIK
jgi:hypothetical protein